MNNTFVKVDCEKQWNQCKNISGAKFGNTSRLYPDYDFGKAYVDCTIIEIPYKCNCPPDKCGCKYFIIENEVIKAKKISLDNSTGVSESINIDSNDNHPIGGLTQMPNISWSFRSPPLKRLKLINNDQIIDFDIKENNNNQTQNEIDNHNNNNNGNSVRDIELSIRNFQSDNMVNNNSNMNVLIDNEIIQNDNPNVLGDIEWSEPRENINDSESSDDESSESDGSNNDNNNDNNNNISESPIVNNENTIKICLTTCILTKFGKKVKESEISNCHMRHYSSLKNENGDCIGSVFVIQFYDENDKLNHLNVHVPSLQLYWSKPEKIVEIMCKSIALRGGNRAFFHPNPKDHLSVVFLRNFILEHIATSTKVVQSISNYGLVTQNNNGDIKRYISWKRNDMFNLDSGEVVIPSQVGFWIDHVVREKDVSSAEILRNYPKIVPGQKFEPLEEKHIKLANSLCDEDNEVLLCTLFGLSIPDIISLFKTYGGVKPSVILLSLPGLGKSWILNMLSSKYGISAFHPDDPGASVTMMDDYSGASLEDQGKSYFTMDMQCEDIERKGNKSAGGGFETFVWKGSGFAKQKTRGGGDVAAIQSIKIGTMNTPPNKRDDGTLSRCIIWLFEQSSNGDIYKNKSKLLTDSHELSVAIQSRSIYIHTQKISRQTIEQCGEIVEKMKNTVKNQMTILEPYIMDRKFDIYTVLMSCSCIISHALLRKQPNKVANVFWKYIIKELKFQKELKTTNMKELNFKYNIYQKNKVIEFLNIAFICLNKNLKLKCEIDKLIVNISELEQKQLYYDTNHVMLLKSYDSNPCLCIWQDNKQQTQIHFFKFITDLISKNLMNEYDDIDSFETYIDTFSDWKKACAVLDHHNVLVLEPGYKTRRIQINGENRRYHVVKLNASIVSSEEYEGYKHNDLDLQRKKAKKDNRKKKNKINNNLVSNSNVVKLENVDFINLCEVLIKDLMKHQMAILFTNKDCHILSEYNGKISQSLNFESILVKISNKEFNDEFEFFNDVSQRFLKTLNYFDIDTDHHAAATNLQRLFQIKFTELCSILQKCKVSNKKINEKEIGKINGVGQR
eukprot:502813_1